MQSTKYLAVGNLFGEEGFDAETYDTAAEAIQHMIERTATYTGIPLQTLQSHIQTKGIATDHRTYEVDANHASVDCRQGWRYRCRVYPLQTATKAVAVIIRNEKTFQMAEFPDIASAQRFMINDFARNANLDPCMVYNECINNYDMIELNRGNTVINCDENGGSIYDSKNTIYFSQVFSTIDASQLIQGIPIF